ncbi:uncharacterized protein LOC132724797 [Ruditapes philippinarum]|uniref:uncharacterized protein LOC132724797 n=1 Tax=Ruditapes philippinarum TaxID=129788 RepID=UPI00295C19C3|nr:uncharacterized protein LOC132724797 [Ruditapes philippinarum]
MERFKMYNLHFFQLILLLIFDSVNGNMECDCNTIAAIQEVMQKEFFQIKLENSKMASRLRRLEASSKQSKTMNHQHLETVSDMTKDLDSSHDKTRNDIKRIETIESTLARIVPQFEFYIENKTDDIKQRIHGQRIDKVESELALVSNKTDSLLDMNDGGENAMVQLKRTIRKAFHGEKIKGLNFKLKINEKVKNIEKYCVNFTISSGQLIDEFKKEVAIETKEFAAEMNQKEININNTINDIKFDAISRFDDLENALSKTKKTLSNLEDIILKDRTDGGWSSWGSFGSCSDTCGRGVMIRSRTCSQPKPSLRGKHCEGSPIQIAVCNTNTCPEMRIFFTATGITGSDTAIFPKSIQNYGNGYDKSTGHFKCKYPGIYMFSFQISKPMSYTGFMYCKIYLNDLHIVGAVGNPDSDVDIGFSISVSGTFHLNTNDEVYVSGCVGIAKAYNDYDSSFTGVLIVPDNI